MLLDEIDRALLTALTANSRTPIATLGQQLGIARTTVQVRIDRLENRGVIAGYTVRLGKTSQPALRATALVAIEPRAAPAVLSRLKSIHNVVAVHTTSGRFDLLVQLTAQTTEELDVTLDHIGAAQGVKSSESLISQHQNQSWGLTTSGLAQALPRDSAKGSAQKPLNFKIEKEPGGKIKADINPRLNHQPLACGGRQYNSPPKCFWISPPKPEVSVQAVRSCGRSPSNTG